MKNNNIYSIVVGLASILAISFLTVDIFFVLPEQVDLMITYCDYLLCGFFFVDFIKHLIHAPNKTKYFFTLGWLDLLSSFPSVDFLRFGRISKVFGLIRVYRVYKAGKFLTTTFFRDLKSNAFFLSLSFAALSVQVSSVLILLCETDAKSNIKSAGEAIWWSFVTMATVGYGDYYPVTLWGRVVGVLLMMTGISFFGVLTATLAGLLMGDRKEEQSENAKLVESIQLLSQKIDHLEKQLKENTKTDAP